MNENGDNFYIWNSLALSLRIKQYLKFLQKETYQQEEHTYFFKEIGTNKRTNLVVEEFGDV